MAWQKKPSKHAACLFRKPLTLQSQRVHLGHLSRRQIDFDSRGLLTILSLTRPESPETLFHNDQHVSPYRSLSAVHTVSI